MSLTVKKIKKLPNLQKWKKNEQNIWAFLINKSKLLIGLSQTPD